MTNSESINEISCSDLLPPVFETELAFERGFDTLEGLSSNLFATRGVMMRLGTISPDDFKDVAEVYTDAYVHVDCRSIDAKLPDGTSRRTAIVSLSFHGANGNTVTVGDYSEPDREQDDSLISDTIDEIQLDQSRRDWLIEAIAEAKTGRALRPFAVDLLIDRSPFPIFETFQHGIDVTFNNAATVAGHWIQANDAYFRQNRAQVCIRSLRLTTLENVEFRYERFGDGRTTLFIRDGGEYASKELEPIQMPKRIIESVGDEMTVEFQSDLDQLKILQILKAENEEIVRYGLDKITEAKLRRMSNDLQAATDSGVKPSSKEGR